MDSFQINNIIFPFKLRDFFFHSVIQTVHLNLFLEFNNV